MLGRKNGMLYELDAGSSVLDSQHTALITSNGQAKLSIAESRMWHRRLGHPGKAAIKSIVKGYVNDGRICEVCIQAKLKRKTIRVPVQRTTTPFALVHSDLCGPFAVHSSGSAQYFIVYIDDYSHHAEITVLPDKRAETCTAAFQWFQAKVDGRGYDIWRFRSDNGSGEYNNKTLRSILAIRGIAFEPCPPHTQHKNGIAERMIGVLSPKARAMMLNSQAPIHFWSEAINTTCYLHRRTPNQSLDGKTPNEVLKCHRRLYRSGYYANSQCVGTALDGNSHLSTAIGNSQRVSTAIGNSQHVSTAIGNSQHVSTAIGNSQHVSTATGNSQRVGTALDRNSQRVSTAIGNSQSMSTAPSISHPGQNDTTSAEDKPTLDHLRRFGCVVWKHIPKSQRMDAKMGTRAKACMVLGYVHGTTKIWRIWDPDFGKAINCSDVYFDESQTAYISCMMADNGHSVDPLGLPEEDPVITEVIEDPPEDISTNPLVGMGSVEEAPVLDPCENTIPLPAGMGSVEEAPVLDPQSVPNGAPNASPSQPRMLTRSQSRRAARAGTTLAAEVSTDDDPRSYREAMNGPLQRQWKDAMQQEYTSLLENHTFTPVEYARSKPIGCKWVYKTKTNPDGTLRYKARLVIKGYEQMQGIDFDETYALVSKMTTLRYLISRAAHEDWEIDQLDVVTAFLNPAIDKEAYMQLPEGIKWLIVEPLASPSSPSSLADSTHKSTHNPCAEAHSVSRPEERFVESTRSQDLNSQHASTTPGNSQVSTTPGNSQRVSTVPGNSQRVTTTTAPDPMAIYMNGSL